MDRPSNKTTRLGWVVWWELPQFMNADRLSRICDTYHMRFKVSPRRNDAPKSVRDALRYVFPACQVTQVGTVRKSRNAYRRYQVDQRQIGAGKVMWSPIEIVRVYANARIVCEWNPENELLLNNYLKVRNESISGAAFSSSLRRYFMDVLEAVPLGGVYLVSNKHFLAINKMTTLFRRLRGLSRTAYSGARIYVFRVDVDLQRAKSIRYHLTTYYANRLNEIIKTLFAGEVTVSRIRKAVRSKTRLKREVRQWELKIGRRMYNVRALLAHVVLDYEELKDLNDEWKST